MNDATATPLPLTRRRAFFSVRSPLPAPVVRGRILVIHHRRDSLWQLTKVQGLFSEFFAVLGALRYAEQHGAAAVRVRFESDLYRDDRLGPNWWDYFFANPMWLDRAQPAAREVHCRGWHRFGPHAWNESWTTQIVPHNSDLRPYPLNSATELREVARLTARHIRVHPPLLAAADAFKAAHVAPGEFLIGLHFRGTDKIRLHPRRSPSFDAYRAEVEHVLAAARPARHRIFVATDQAEFADWAQATFGERLFLQEDSPRLALTDPIAASHGTHKHPHLSPESKGRAAVLACLLLARCDYLIKNRSCLSDIALAFNPDLPWTFLLDHDTVERGAPIARSLAP